jgi:trehalose-6-phosphate synthase
MRSLWRRFSWLLVNQRDGVLVLSPTAGAFEQLAKASIPISPTDMAETAQALYTRGYRATDVPLSHCTTRRLEVSVAVVQHSSVSTSRSPHHFFVHRRP